MLPARNVYRSCTRQCCRHYRTVRIQNMCNRYCSRIRRLIQPSLFSLRGRLLRRSSCAGRRVLSNNIQQIVLVSWLRQKLAYHLCPRSNRLANLSARHRYLFCRGLADYRRLVVFPKLCPTGSATVSYQRHLFRDPLLLFSLDLLHILLAHPPIRPTL